MMAWILWEGKPWKGHGAWPTKEWRYWHAISAHETLAEAEAEMMRGVEREMAHQKNGEIAHVRMSPTMTRRERHQVAVELLTERGWTFWYQCQCWPVGVTPNEGSVKEERVVESVTERTEIDSRTGATVCTKELVVTGRQSEPRSDGTRPRPRPCWLCRIRVAMLAARR